MSNDTFIDFEGGDRTWVYMQAIQCRLIGVFKASETTPEETSRIYKVYDDLHQWLGELGYNRVPTRWSLEVYSKWSKHENHVDICNPINLEDPLSKLKKEDE